MVAPDVHRQQAVLQVSQIAFLGLLLPAVVLFAAEMPLWQACLIATAAGLAGPPVGFLLLWWRPNVRSAKAAALLTGALAAGVSVVASLTAGGSGLFAWVIPVQAVVMGALWGGLFYLFHRSLWNVPEPEPQPS